MRPTGYHQLWIEPRASLPGLLIEIEKALLIDAKKERHRLIAKMKLEQPQLYAYIWRKMSKESVDKLKRHENYDSFDNSKNPLGLWMQQSSCT